MVGMSELGSRSSPLCSSASGPVAAGFGAGVNAPPGSRVSSSVLESAPVPSRTIPPPGVTSVAWTVIVIGLLAESSTGTTCQEPAAAV